MPSPTISLVYLVYNQKDLLISSLAKSATFVKDIHIFDLSSQEDIKAVAKKYQAHYHLLPYTQVVETVRAKVFATVGSDYILYLDADEQINQSLFNKLRQAATSDFDYVYLPRTNYVFGHWMKASRWWPDYQLRFFKPSQVKWPQVLHSEAIPTGKELRLPPTKESSLIHYNYQNIDEWLSKNQRYARFDAQNRLEQNQEYSLLHAMKLSVSELVSRYFASKGYLDGIFGLMLSILQSFYYYLVYAYYWEGKKYEQLESSKKIQKFPQQWFRHGLSEILFWDRSDQNILTQMKQKLVRKIIHEKN